MTKTIQTMETLIKLGIAPTRQDITLIVIQYIIPTIKLDF